MTRSCKEAAVYILPPTPPPSSAALNGLGPVSYPPDQRHPPPTPTLSPKFQLMRKQQREYEPPLKPRYEPRRAPLELNEDLLFMYATPAPDYWHLLPPRAVFSSCSDATPRVKDWIAAPSK